MGGVAGMFGGGGGSGGTGYAAPAAASIQTPTSTQQATNAYGMSQSALQQQQAFLQAVQAQNGLQNQSNVYNQLQGVASGTGPNPAQAQLAQATGQNVANQASLMAGQRGANANVGLMARQAAQQGAGIQQQAAGQAATLQAQQSLNALSGMGNLATQQAGQQAQATGAYTGATQSEQEALLNSIAAQNNANVNMQSNMNTVNGQLVGQQLGAQDQMFGNAMSNVGSAFQLVGGGSSGGGAGGGIMSQVPLVAKGGEVKHYDGGGTVTPPGNGQYVPIDPNNDPFNAPVAQAPQTQAPVSQPNQPKVTGPQSNVGKAMTQPAVKLNPANTAAQTSAQSGAQVGAVIGKAIGNMINPMAGNAQPGSLQSQVNQTGYLPKYTDPVNTVNTPQTASPLPAPDQSKPTYVADDKGEVSAPEQTNMAKGGKVPAMVSPGERYLKPDDVKKVAKGANPMKIGERIPGKPKVSGAKNSYANDTVPKELTEGGIVIPRSITQGKNPHWESMKFVRAIMAKNGKGLK
jgi:hypothetical protein